MSFLVWPALFYGKKEEKKETMPFHVRTDFKHARSYAPSFQSILEVFGNIQLFFIKMFLFENGTHNKIGFNFLPLIARI